MVRLFRHYVPRLILLLAVAEATVFLASGYIGAVGAVPGESVTNRNMTSGAFTAALLYALATISTLIVMGLYERGLRDGLYRLWLRIAMGLVLGIVLNVALHFVSPGVFLGGNALGIALVLSAIGIFASRTLAYHIVQRGFFKPRAIVLGTGEWARQIEQTYNHAKQSEVNLIGYVAIPQEACEVSREKVLLNEGTLLELCGRHGVDRVVVALKERRSSLVVDQLLQCKMNGIEVMDIGCFLERLSGKISLESLTPGTVVFADGFVQALRRGLMHRAFDLIISALAVAVLSPIMLIVAGAIWLESRGRGSILYRQIRVGRNGQLFEMLKFRSMRADAEKDGKAMWAAENDSRITSVGRLIRKAHIDELPQLLNVLKGEMSFVGPRPERPEFVVALSQQIPYYDVRHCVNPGLTGWAQIRYPYGASELDAREKLQYDLYYIKNYSLFLDITILVQTLQAVFWSSKGAR